MKYYKYLPCEFYRKNKIIDTQYDNYGLWDKIAFSKISKSADFIINSAKETNLPLSLFFFILAYVNGKSLSSEMSLPEILSNDKNIDLCSKIAINDLVGCKDSLQFVEKTVLIHYANLAKNYSFPFLNGSHLWEYLGEKIRKQCDYNLPSRLNSYFLFDSIQSIDYYQQKHGQKVGFTVAQVELLEIKQIDSFDMKIWDMENNNIPFNECEKNIKKYWESKYNTKEIPEFLFQGKLKLL